LATKSVNANIVSLSALVFLWMNFVISIPQEWTQHVLVNLEEATVTYMVEVVAESHC
jgi:hypothetical protein